jgi:hypothetical protein
MRVTINASLCAAAMLLGVPAVAGPSPLVQCDGYAGRVGTAESLARATVIIGTLGLLGSAERDNTAAIVDGEKGVAACTAALTDSRVTSSVQRHAEVLLARSIRQLEAGAFDLAFADGEAILALPVPAAQKTAFDRTLGVSARLVQASVRVAQQRQADAEVLALAATDLRPYGRFMPGRAAQILQLTPAISAGEAALLDRLARINTAGLVIRISAREGAGDWTGAAADLAALVATRQEPDVVNEARLATVLALAGRNADALAAVNTAQQHIDELAAKSTGTDSAAQAGAQRVQRADEMVQLAHAQLALSAGQLDDAKTLLGGRTRWMAPAPIVAAVIANAKPKINSSLGSLALDPAKLLTDRQTAMREDVYGKKGLQLMFVTYSRWEDPGVAARFGRDLYGSGSTAIKVDTERSGHATRVRFAQVPAFVDTATEALLLAGAVQAQTRKADSFAVIEDGGSFYAGREGMTTMAPSAVLVFPDDPLWPSQTSRALSVATVNAALEPLYPAPSATPAR